MTALSYVNGASTVPLLGQTIGDALHDTVERFGERPALIVRHQGYRATYAELWAQTSRAARGLLARGVPDTARPFGGLVYRQALEHLQGVRDEPETRALIARETRRYARRQLIWFRKEPNLVWLHGSGEDPSTLPAVEAALAARVQEMFR